MLEPASGSWERGLWGSFGPVAGVGRGFWDGAGGGGRVPVWARSRSVKNAAVLTPQNTRRKNRRF